MVAVAYLIPVIACLLLHFEFDYDGKWSAYLWIMVFGEGTAGLLHWLFYDLYTSSTEYLGSIVHNINHEESWVELIEVKETKTDSKGNSYTEIRIKEEYHAEKYYLNTSRGSRIDISSGFYAEIRSLWGLAGHTLHWTGSNIKGGVRYGTRYDMADFSVAEREDPANWVPITESSSYTNKVRSSNSIFKFEKISKEEAAEMGLLDYPAIYSHDAPCVLSNDYIVSEDVNCLFRKFNARYAPEFQMRLYILVFDAGKGISLTEHQRAYWQGGNKNEFVVCIGMKPDGAIAWARAFSWADEQNKEIETAQWLMHHPNLDWNEFHDWLRWHLTDWKRKEFKDFDYISITLPLWQTLCILLGVVLISILALYIALH